MTHRALKITRGPANRDPMFAPQWVGAAAILVCLGLLVESFGRDVVWQFRQRHAEVVVVPRRTESAAEPYQG